MRKKLLVYIGVLLTLGIIALVIADQTIYRTVTGLGNREIYMDVQEFLKAPDLVTVIKAKATGRSENVVYHSVGGYPDGYTLSEIEVLEVLENPGQVELPDRLMIREPTYEYKSWVTVGTTRITNDTYTPLVKEAEYILFLGWHPRHQLYGIYSSDQGKVNIDGRDAMESEGRVTGDYLDTLHRSIKSAYLN